MKKITLFLFAIFFAAGINAQNTNITFQANLPYPNQTCANIWGYVDSLGNEYALVGASLGLSIVDVTVPTNPVQVAQIIGPNNLWKEVKTYRNYAYVVSEGGQGVQIIDLRHLPTTNLPNHYWQPTIGTQQLNKVHALYVDTANARLYLYGGDLAPGGAIVADLSVDPYNPTYLGRYSADYIHDGYVRGDTLYGGHIYNGYFSIIDMSNPATPQVLQTQQTPGNFTHNTWLSDDSKTLFTTDEVTDSYLTSYDISDINNIVELDRIQSNPGSGSIVHNTHIKNDWAVTSWYRDGVVIVDGHRPQNLVQVANYDTYAGAGDGFDGAWGVYPYLPSGNLVISNIDEGLYVLSPTYVRACYLEGNVIDSICGTPLTGVTVTIVSTGITDATDLTGVYRTGYHTPGTYTVTFSKPGYNTRTFTNVNLAASIVTSLNVMLYSPTAISFNGTVTNSTSAAMPGVNVVMSNSTSNYNFTTDGSGDFSSCNVLAGTYDLITGAWGYKQVCTTQNISTGNATANIQLQPGYYDDFALDYGWTVTATASTGAWERGVPAGTDFNNPGDANPGVDVGNDCSNMAYVTGNGGGTASTDDVDNGATVLTSPVFDLSTYTNPFMFYSRWFFNSGGSGNPNDSLTISISNGTNTVRVETVLANTAGSSSWVPKSFRIANYVTPTANMRLIVRTADASPGHVVEAGFDRFFIADSAASAGAGVHELTLDGGVKVYPNPFSGSTLVDYDLGSADAGQAVITDVAGRLVMTMPLTQKSGTLKAGEGLAEGVYFIHISSGNLRSQPVKLVKLK
jgi:choice-of-anchor B domain-containing protein